VSEGTNIGGSPTDAPTTPGMRETRAANSLTKATTCGLDANSLDGNLKPATANCRESKPAGTLTMRTKLLMKRPAPVSSTSVSAICTA
jgi:hypothetical protein